MVPRLEHVSADVSRQSAGVHEFEVCGTVPASPMTLHAVGRVTIQNRFEALSEDIVDVVGQVDEPSCAPTWKESTRAEGSAGDHRSVAMGQCEAVPASINADFRGRIHRCHRPPPLREFDLTLEDSEDDPSALEAEPFVPPPVPLLSDDAESVEWSIQGDSEDTVSLPEVEVEIPHFRVPQLRGAFAMMDLVDARTIFRQRAVVMKSVPRFLHGPFRNALKLAMEEVLVSGDPLKQREGVNDVAKNASASTSRGRAHLTGKVDCKIRIISTWRLAHLFGSQRSLRFQSCPVLAPIPQKA